MTPPGDRVRRIAARVCSATTMARLVDPVLADLQAEHAVARRQGRVWASRRIRISGHGALLKAMVADAGVRAAHAAAEGTREEHQVVLRVVGCATVVAAVAIITLVFPIARRWLSPAPETVSWPVTIGDRLTLFGYLLPAQALLGVPIGLALGIPFALRGHSISRRASGLIAAVGLMASMATLLTSAWILPAANQAYRATVWAHLSGSMTLPPPGAPELTLGALSRRITTYAREGDTAGARSLTFQYQLRWALPCAPIVLAVLALAWGRLLRGRRFVQHVAGVGSLFLYYVLIFGGRAGADGPVPAAVAAWLPNAAMLGTAIALVRVSSRRSNAAAHS